MKKLLLSILATIGYLAVYLIVTTLVAFAGAVYYAVSMTLNTHGAALSYQDLAVMLNNYIVENSPLLTIIASVISLFLFWIILKIRRKPLKERLDLKAVPFRNVWPLLLLGVSLNLLVIYIVGILPIPEDVFNQYANEVSAIQGNTLPGFLLAVLIAPITEEVLLRGFILKSLQKGMPTVVALILQAVIFGSLHGQILWIAYATILGVAFGLLKIRYRSLYAGIVLHFSFNAANYITTPLLSLAGEQLLAHIALAAVAVATMVLMLIRIMKRTRPSETVVTTPLELPANN